MRSTPSIPGIELALARFPRRMRRALQLFRRITGLTAVTSLAASLPEFGQPPPLSPPVHPRCALRLRSVRAAPCGRQWLFHLRSSRRSPNVVSHTCPIGLRCSLVPVRLGGQVVGVAKLVSDSGTTEPDFFAATEVLKLAVTGICQDSLVSILSGEIGALRENMAEFQQIHSSGAPHVDGSESPVAAPGRHEAGPGNGALVARALAYLQRHFQDPSLSLPVVARSLGCNPKYLTASFTKIVGERMHAYLVALRVAHASRLLMSTELPIKETSYASGFRGPAPFARAFRQAVGVSPANYRRIFSAF